MPVKTITVRPEDRKNPKSLDPGGDVVCKQVTAPNGDIMLYRYTNIKAPYFFMKTIKKAQPDCTVWVEQNEPPQNDAGDAWEY